MSVMHYSSCVSPVQHNDCSQISLIYGVFFYFFFCEIKSLVFCHTVISEVKSKENVGARQTEDENTAKSPAQSAGY